MRQTDRYNRACYCVVVKSKNVLSTNVKRPATTVDNVERERQRQVNDIAAAAGDKSSSRAHLHVKHSAPQTGRTTPRSTPDHQAAQSPSAGGGSRHRAVDVGAQGKRRPGGVDRGSDSDTRVRFADNTVVQTSDGRAVIIDDSVAAADRDRRPTQSKRSQSIGGTLPARIRDAADVARITHKSSQRVQPRPASALFDEDDQRPGPGSGSAAVRTTSVPTMMNVLHTRSNSAAVAKPRKVTVTQPAPPPRRAVDPNYYRESTSVRIQRR